MLHWVLSFPIYWASKTLQFSRLLCLYYQKSIDLTKRNFETYTATFWNENKVLYSRHATLMRSQQTSFMTICKMHMTCDRSAPFLYFFAIHNSLLPLCFGQDYIQTLKTDEESYILLHPVQYLIEISSYSVMKYLKTKF